MDYTEMIGVSRGQLRAMLPLTSLQCLGMSWAVSWDFAAPFSSSLNW